MMRKNHQAGPVICSVDSITIFIVCGLDYTLVIDVLYRYVEMHDRDINDFNNSTHSPHCRIIL